MAASESMADVRMGMLKFEGEISEAADQICPDFESAISLARNIAKESRDVQQARDVAWENCASKEVQNFANKFNALNLPGEAPLGYDAAAAEQKIISRLFRGVTRIICNGVQYKLQGENQQDLSRSMYPSFLRFNPEGNCFESDGYPELADFATKLKVRCDKNHAVMIKNSPLLSQANECLKLARRACGEGNKKAFIALRCKMLMELSRATFDLDSEYGYMGNKTSFWAEVNFLNSGLIAVGRAKGWA